MMEHPAYDASAGQALDKCGPSAPPRAHHGDQGLWTRKTSGAPFIATGIEAQGQVIITIW